MNITAVAANSQKSTKNYCEWINCFVNNHCKRLSLRILIKSTWRCVFHCCHSHTLPSMYKKSIGIDYEHVLFFFYCFGLSSSSITRVLFDF